MRLIRKRLTREETRERIMAKADELFRQFGFGKTTVAEIAAELDMSPANIYKFFSSKDAIVQAGAERALAALSEEIDRDANEPGTVLGRIEKILLRIYRHFVGAFRNERQIFKLLDLAHEQKWECVRQFDQAILKTLTGLVEEGIKTKEFRSGNPSILAHLVFDSLTLVMMPHSYPREGGELNADRVSKLVRFVGRALK